MNKGGRPTDYRPEYCDALIAHMEKGYSYESFAGTLRVSKQTLYDWEKANAEFLDAKLTGVELSRLFWEGLAINHMTGKVSKQDVEMIRSAIEDNGNHGPVNIKIEGGYFNNQLWQFNMKNRFKAEWRDKQELEHSGPDGKPLQQTPVTIIIPDNRRDGKK